jgi:hypothetical protein
MNRVPVCRLFALTLALVLAALTSVAAQQAMTPQDRADNDLMVYFYSNPRPERLVGFLERIEKGNPEWSAYPPIAGFFAVLFRRNPDWIGKLVPAHFDAKTAAAITAALQLSGQSATPQSIRSLLTEAGSDARLKAELAGLPPRLEDLRIVTPTHLDILWGAFFASGDEHYVRMIVDFFAQTANRSESTAIDITKSMIAMAGGPKEILGQLKGKYGDALAREIIFAATAEWALVSNARQHPTVEKTVATYIAENSGTYAAKSLSVLRPPKK